MSEGRVVVAMSGGVDSSLAAALLKKQGYDVIGVTMQLWPGDNSSDCCGLGGLEAAKDTAAWLGIHHYTLDFRGIFQHTVIANFLTEYSHGRTPNPCIICNRYVKFDALLHRAFELEADFLATGHYARIDHSEDGYRLLAGTDGHKDQSYFLYGLGQRQLKHLLFPIGHLSKTDVREKASYLGLPSADRAESQDICFITGDDYRSFLREHNKLEPGEIVDAGGNILGYHRGLALYTIGQRRGMGLALGQRLYVLRLEPEKNRVVVGGAKELLSRSFKAGKLSWISGRPPQTGQDIKARIRFRAPRERIELTVKNGRAEVCLDQPQPAVAPGQAVVFYCGEVVLGGGTIEEVPFHGG